MVAEVQESPDSTKAEEGEITNEFDLADRPGLKEVLGAELKALALEGMRFKKLMDEAKTSPKKKLYKKKLAKNSKRAAELILYLERLQISEAIEQAKQEQEFIDTRDSENDDAEGRASE